MNRELALVLGFLVELSRDKQVQVVAYLCVRLLRFNRASTAKILGITRGTVARYVFNIDEMVYEFVYKRKLQLPRELL